MIEFLSHPVISFIILLLVIVSVHEYGHYVAARFFNVKIDQFSIGFGKEIFGFYDKHQTRWRLSLLPLGGYVKLYGHNTLYSNEKNEIENPELAFDYKPAYQKILIALAGPLFNILLCFMIFTTTNFIEGELDCPPIIKEVVENFPADKAGVEVNDRILKVNDREVDSFFTIAQIIASSIDGKIKFTIQRDSEQKTFDMQAQKVNNAWKVGVISYDPIIVSMNLLQSMTAAFNKTVSLFKVILYELWRLIKLETDLANLGGIISISDGSSKAAAAGISNFFIFMAIFSVNLAIINLLPIPALDGGYVILYAMEYFFSKQKLARFHHYALRFGVIILICLMLLANFNDIVRLLN